MKKISIVISLFFIAVSIGVFCVAWTYPEEFSGAVGPGFFPMIIAGIVFFLSVLLLVNIRKQKADESGAFFTKANAMVLLSLVITALYVAAIGVLGFLLSTVLYLIGLMKFFRVKSRILPLLVSGLTTGILYCVFTLFLSVQLPRGIFF